MSTNSATTKKRQRQRFNEYSDTGYGNEKDSQQRVISRERQNKQRRLAYELEAL